MAQARKSCCLAQGAHACYVGLEAHNLMHRLLGRVAPLRFAAALESFRTVLRPGTLAS